MSLKCFFPIFSCKAIFHLADTHKSNCYQEKRPTDTVIRKVRARGVSPCMCVSCLVRGHVKLARALSSVYCRVNNIYLAVCVCEPLRAQKQKNANHLEYFKKTCQIDKKFVDAECVYMI